jgi:hypothetical protein
MREQKKKRVARLFLLVILSLLLAFISIEKVCGGLITAGNVDLIVIRRVERSVERTRNKIKSFQKAKTQHRR